jgi:tRNA threonylcarbamoyladenosine biosynthesis protein TsaE
MKNNNFAGKIFATKNSKETQRVGMDFAKILKRGDVVCLYGDLGFGKTTLVQGIAQGLGIKKRIISPTFVIARSYGLKGGNFYHIDLYRIGNDQETEDLGMEEILSDKNNIIVIEWAEKLKNFLPQRRIDIEFFYEKNNTRKIVFRSLNQ